MERTGNQCSAAALFSAGGGGGGGGSDIYLHVRLSGEGLLKEHRTVGMDRMMSSCVAH